MTNEQNAEFLESYKREEDNWEKKMNKELKRYNKRRAESVSAIM